MRWGMMLAGGALLLAACAGSQNEPLQISEVDVTADLTSIGTPEAVRYWQGLEADLETAIASQFVGQIDPTGNRITVDIDELSLTSAFAPAATAESAALRGRVELLNPAGTIESAYDVTAAAQDVVDFLPVGTNIVTVEPTSAMYYQAIVEAFARGVATTLRAES